MNEKYGRLEVISEPFIKNKQKFVLCKCLCGNNKEIRFSHIKDNNIKSCGCLVKEQSRINGQKNKKHGLEKHPLYRVWKAIISRCYKNKDIGYKNYGGRGIVVYDRWKENLTEFYNWAISHGWENGLQIDRINNNGNYEPNNCRFVTRKINLNNTRKNYIITAFNTTKTVAQWCEDFRCNVTRQTLINRVNAGWNPETAITKLSRVKS